MKKDFVALNEFQAAFTIKKTYSLNDWFLKRDENKYKIPYLTRKHIYEDTSKTIN